MSRPEIHHIVDVVSPIGTLSITRDGSYVVVELTAAGRRASRACAGINDIDFDYFGEPVLRVAEYLFWLDPVALTAVHQALCDELGDAFRDNVAVPPVGICSDEAHG